MSNTRPYRLIFSGRKRLRPDARMSVEDHLRVGSLLKEVSSTCLFRKSITRWVGKARCELDEWVMREFSPAELSSETFHGMYYGSEGGAQSLRQLSHSRATDLVQKLERAHEILVKSYPDCKPLRDVLKNVDRAKVAVEAWAK